MLQLRIVSPERIEFTHAPIISILTKGVVEYDGQQLAILGGFVEVQKNKVSLCVERQE